MTANETLESLRDTAVAAAVAGGQETLKWFRQPIGVENKAAGTGFDPVTAADKACERVIREHIQAQFPDHAIRGEEFDDVGSGEWTWLIDPIDGTRAFISGFVHWGVLLGLLHNDKPHLGVMVQPFLGEVFVGDGESANYVRDGKSIAMHTRETQNLQEMGRRTHTGANRECGSIGALRYGLLSVRNGRAWTVGFGSRKRPQTLGYLAFGADRTGRRRRDHKLAR